MAKKSLIIILVVAIIIVGFSIIFLLFVNREGTKQNISKPDLTSVNISGNLLIKEEYLSYILNELGAYNLHNPPALDEKPVIKFNLDGEFFSSEIENSRIITRKGDFGQEDLLFTTTKSEIVNAINSDNMSEYFIDSIRAGRVKLEIKADKTKLFLKGYLAIYKEITGQEINPD